MTFLRLLALIGLLTLIHCTPKTTSQVSTSDTNQTTSEPVKTGPCATFEDTGKSDQMIEWHVLYRDALKREDYTTAEQYWRKVFKAAPAADGKRSIQFTDGAAIYDHKYNQTEDATLKKEYVDTIMQIYDQMEGCYGGDGYISGIKGFDLYFTYPGSASNQEVWSLFKKSMDTDGDTANVFIINPMTDLLVKNYFDEAITLDEAKNYGEKILRRIQIAIDKKENPSQWDIVRDYAPQRLEIFEGVKGYYGCDYFKDKYYTAIGTLPDDCDELRSIYGKLKFGGCPDGDPAYAALETKMKQSCKVTTTSSGASEAYTALQNGDYQKAIDLFSEKANTTSDPMQKSKYEFIISKIYYAHLKQFPNARTWALKAAKSRPNWGDPFILIGQLYASSGPLCGPGRGWDSQVVVWPAIDKWNYAKQIDPSVAAEANKWINRYSQYMPKKADVFMRGSSVGGTYKVGCWIQEQTRVRTAD